MPTPPWRELPTLDGREDNLRRAWSPPPIEREKKMVLGFDVHRDRANLQRELSNVILERLRGEPCSDPHWEGCSLVRLQQAVRLNGQGLDDFGRVLGDPIEKQALREYAATELPYQKLTAAADFKSFRPHDIVRRGDFALADTSEMAEVQHGFIEDAGGETVQVRSKGTILSLTRKAVINDDLAALRELTVAAAAAVAAEKQGAFSSILLSNPVLSDGIDYFHATRANLLTGAALDATSLGLSIAALRKQRSPAGAALNLAARFLVVGPALEVTARRLVRELTVDGGTRLEVVVAAEILDGRHYVFADPARRPGFVAGDLGGQPLEIVSRWAFHDDAYQFRVLTHYGVGAVDPRAAVLTPTP